MSFVKYEPDLKTQSAVERQLQIITEAAHRLGSDAASIAPSIDWRGWVGMGNILRHAYHRVDAKTVWNTVVLELPLLREAVSRALAENLGATENNGR